MRIERTKNAVRNIFFGTLNRIVGILLPFASRTIILYVLGTKYLGLSSLFSSILSFLSLAELGVGNAMVYSMYRPIAENDTVTIRALLNVYRRFYRVIGTVILVLGLLLMPFLRRLIHDELPPDINLYVLYFIYLMNAVVSYWVFAYKTALLHAHQRMDIDSKISMINAPLSYIVMLGFLLLTKNYYAYVIWLPVFTILYNIVRARFADKLFPALTPEGKIEPELMASITKKTKALIGTKLNTVVLHAADNLVMSAFLGLTVIAMYGNYYYIMSSIIGFLGICYGSMTAGLGNSLAIESLEKNYRDFEKFSFINSWLVGWCAVCLICLYQPFMFLWTGPDLMFPFSIVLLFGLYFYIYMIRKIPVTYKDAAGIWWEDRFRPYVCMVVNLVANIILVQILDVAGIILSTVFSLLISIPWENYTIFKYVFHRSSRPYYGKMLFSLLTMGIGGAAAFFLCGLLDNGYLQFIARGMICLIVPNAIFAALNFRRREFGDSLRFVSSVFKRKKQ